MPYSRVSAVITNSPRLTWIGAAFGVVLLLWVRAPDAFATPQFYAEDANVFWISWRNLGVTSFWKTYSGYLHLYPRLGAALAYPLPYSLHPAAFLVFATVGYAWTAITITTARLPTALGLSLALSMMLVPHWGEIWGSLVNVQWIMACALPVIVSTVRPDQSCARINQMLFVVVSGLTGPFSAIILPLWLARTVSAFRSRCNYSLALCALGMCAGVIQLLFVLAEPAQPYPPNGDDISAIALAVVRRSGLHSLTWFGGTVIGSCLFAFLLLSPLKSTGSKQRLTFILFGTLLQLSILTKLRQVPELGDYDRYFFIPHVMLLWTAVSAIWSTDKLMKVFGTATTILILSASTLHFPRNRHEIYSDWRDKSPLIDKETVQVNYPPGWQVTITKQ